MSDDTNTILLTAPFVDTTNGVELVTKYLSRNKQLISALKVFHADMINRTMSGDP